MRIIIPLPIDRDELDQLEDKLQHEFGISFDQLMRCALSSWPYMHDLDPPDVNDVQLVSVSRDDFNEWYAAALQLNRITHRLGRKVYDQLAPGLRATFGTDDINLFLIKTMHNGMVLELKETPDA